MVLLFLKIKMYDCYVMYANASEASIAFDELQSFFISFADRRMETRDVSSV